MNREQQQGYFKKIATTVKRMYQDADICSVVPLDTTIASIANNITYASNSMGGAFYWNEDVEDGMMLVILNCLSAINSDPDWTLNKMTNILISKGNDYAGEDRMANFNRAGEMWGIPAGQVFLSLIGVKIARLQNLIGSKTPEHESIQDTLIDLANYCALYIMYNWDFYAVPNNRIKPFAE